MQRFQSVGQYKALIKATRARLGSVFSNCTMIPRQMEPSIRQGRLSYEEQEGGLVAWLDEGAYTSLYVWWSPQGPLPSCACGSRPVILEMMGRRGRETADEHAVAQLMEACGFSRERDNLQFVLDIGSHGPFSARARNARDRLLESSGLRIECCRDDELAGRVVRLWERRLGIADIPLDHRNFLHEDATVICALDGGGELAGAYWWSDAGQRARMGRHIVTDERFTRRGVASTLVLQGIADAEELGIPTASTWISSQNTQSIALHEGLGFAENGRACVQFVLPAT